MEEDLWEYLRLKVGVLRSALLIASDQHKQESDLRDLISQLLDHYTSFLSDSTPEDASAAVLGRSNASLEGVLTWFGGWRPTSALELVFSIMDIERNKEPLINNVLYSPIQVLSERQLYNINTWQAHMRQAECDLSNRLALLQMLISDQDMIAAINARDWSKTNEVIESKLMQLRDLLVEANNLRVQTLHVLFTILDPMQAAKCIVAAFEIGLSIKSLKECILEGEVSFR